jgi:cholesterol oxidase
MWIPGLKFFGFFKLSFFRHITILSGVGVGGGSLTYANTLPVPKDDFFTSKSWAHLADWKKELEPFYPVALKMLGASRNPRLQVGDKALQQLAQQLGKESEFEATNVAVFFGEPDKTVPDPYFDGKGPDRGGCNFCGGCMIGCQYNAKNTLDKNYLYLAQQLGVTIQPESEVYDVIPIDGSNGSAGYKVKWKRSTRYFKRKGNVSSKNIIFAGGALGTVPLLLKLKKKSLPNISYKLGCGVRTNSESLLGITTFDKGISFSEGIAIGSILHTDEFSHLEPVRYSSGSGFWRILLAPMAHGKNVFIRLSKLIYDFICHPIKNLKAIFVWDFAKRTQILLFMQTINSTLRFSKGLFGMKSSMEAGPAPTAFIPEVDSLAKDYAKIVNGKPISLFTETIMGIPTTAHILGGCVMGKDEQEGVIDKDNRVFGYENMLICDGSMISANPGVNPTLTITALTERAMSKMPEKL